MKNITSITEKNFSEFEQKSILLERKAAKCKLIYGIFTPLQHLLAILTVFFFAYGILYELYIADYAKLYSETKILVSLTNAYNWLLKPFQQFGIPNVLAVILFLMVGLLAIFIVKGLVALFVNIFANKKEEVLKEENIEKKCKTILKRYDKLIYSTVTYKINRFLSVIGFAISALAAIFTVWVAFHTPKEEVIMETIFGVIIVVVLCVVVLAFLFHILISITDYHNSVYSKKEDAIKLLKNYIEKCERDKKAEKERKKEEERKRKEAEERKEIERQKKEQLKENLKKADEMFAALKDDDKADVKKLFEISSLGHHDATLLLASLCFNESNSDLRTEKEQKTFLETMHSALSILDYYNNHSAETKLLYIISSIRLCKFEEYDQVNNALKDLRKIKEKGQLPEDYADVCDKTIKVLVSFVNELEKPKSTYKPTYTSSYTPKEEPLELEPVIWYDFRTGEKLYRNKKTGQIVNAKGEEVSSAWWE